VQKDRFGATNRSIIVSPERLVFDGAAILASPCRHIEKDRRPWPTWPAPDRPDLTHMSRKVKQIVRAAALRNELTFTSFRHGGLTEAGDADLTDTQIRAQSRHTSSKVLSKYVKRTMKQIADGAKKRRAAATLNAQLDRQGRGHRSRAMRWELRILSNGFLSTLTE